MKRDSDEGGQLLENVSLLIVAGLFLKLLYQIYLQS